MNQLNKNLDTLYLIIGPSGSGKTTLVENLKREFPWMKDVKSYTTRKPRYKNENTHTFISEKEFDKLENIVADSIFSEYKYAATKEQLDNANLYVIDVEGIKKLKMNNYHKTRSVLIIGLDITKSQCKKRMELRGDSNEKIGARLEHDKEVFKQYRTYCDIVLDASQTPDRLLADFVNEVASYEMENQE